LKKHFVGCMHQAAVYSGAKMKTFSPAGGRRPCSCPLAKHHRMYFIVVLPTAGRAGPSLEIACMMCCACSGVICPGTHLIFLCFPAG
jgi:hypothetical protein